MNYLYHAYAQMSAAIDAACNGQESAQHLRSAQVSAQVAQAESLQRIAECLETMTEAQTPDAADPDASDAQNYELPIPWEHTNNIWRHAAMDADGAISLYQSEPKCSDARGIWFSRDRSVRHYISVTLPPGVTWRDTLTKRPDAGDAAPAPLADLAPDWSQEEDWVRFYAIDAIGRVRRFETEPIMDTDGAWWKAMEFTRSTEPSHEHGGLPANVDWTRLIWQRPQAQEAARPEWLPEWIDGDIVRRDDDHVIEWDSDMWIMFKRYPKSASGVANVGEITSVGNDRWRADIATKTADGGFEFLVGGNAEHCIEWLWAARHRAWEGR